MRIRNAKNHKLFSKNSFFARQPCFLFATESWVTDAALLPALSSVPPGEEDKHFTISLCLRLEDRSENRKVINFDIGRMEIIKYSVN